MVARLFSALMAASLICCTLGSLAYAEVYTSPDPSLTCAFYSNREAREIFGEKRAHVALCMNIHGWITGAVLSKSGRVRCEIAGFMDLLTGCAVISWCGLQVEIPCD